MRHCGEVREPEAEDNAVRAILADGVRVDLDRLRRNLFASSSCGVCGKATIEAALDVAPPLSDPTRFDAETVYALPGRLREAQPVFDETGGLHAAALFDGEGQLLAAREDVGRHNAVDKIVGWAVRSGRFPLSGHVADGLGARLLRDRAEGPGGADSAGGRRLGAELARGPPGRGLGHRHRRVRAGPVAVGLRRAGARGQEVGCALKTVVLGPILEPRDRARSFQ